MSTLTRAIPTLLLTLALAPAFAQVPGEHVLKPAPKPDFSTEASVIEQLVTKVAFQSDGAFARQQHSRVRIQSDAGVKQYSVLRVPYEGSVETIEVPDVHVIKPDGSSVPTPPDAIQDMTSEVSRDAPLYSDLREKHIAVKGLNVGDVLDFSVRWQHDKPLAPGQFWFGYEFQHQGIVLQEELEISAPTARELKLKSQTVQPATRDEAGRQIYSWKTSHLVSESLKKEHADNVYYQVRGILPPPDVLISSFHSWEEVGRWYEALQQERIQSSPEIKAKAADLTKGLTTDDAKIRAIYDYVSLHYRYVGIDFGIGRYQPHSATEILGNQYGDCKDKHTLLAALLNVAGIQAYPALMNASRTVDPDVPSPGQFDHVISVVAKGNDLAWMDTTSEVAPLGFLLSPLRDKAALVISPQRVAFQTTPAGLPFQSREEFRLSGKLSADGTLDAHAQTTARDEGEFLLRRAFRSTPQAQWKDLVQAISAAEGFAGTVSDIDVSSPEDIGQPFQWKYNYNRKDYADWEHHQILAALPFFGLPEIKDDDLTRKTPQWLGGPGEFDYESRIELPKGFRADLPPALNLREPFAEFDSHSEVVDGTLITTRRLVLKTREAAPDQFKRYNAFLKAISDDASTFIPLKTAADISVPNEQRTGGIMGMTRQSMTDLPNSGNAEALQAETDARDAISQSDVSSAVAALKHAVALDPSFARAWILLGAMYDGIREKRLAIESFQKAIDADPKHPLPYKLLALTYAEDHRNADALATWQKLQAIVPEDRDIATNLGRLLLDEKRYREAAVQFESAAKASPYSANIQLNLGISRIRSGDSENGLVAIHKAVELDSSQLALNDTAYEMAEADTNLPEALGYSQRSVQQLEEQSQKIDLRNIQREDFASATLLGAGWDTLGWIYFKMGNLSLAESYLEAAWQFTQGGITGDHLGQVLEKLHKPAAALHVYSLAMSANPLLTETPARMRNLAHTSPRLTHMSGGEELSRMRSTGMPRIVNGTASADFDVLLAPGGKVEKAAFVTGSELLRDAIGTLEKAPFKQTFPAGSKASLLRRGVLSCNQYTGCSFVFYPPFLAAGPHRGVD